MVARCTVARLMRAMALTTVKRRFNSRSDDLPPLPQRDCKLLIDIAADPRPIKLHFTLWIWE